LRCASEDSTVVQISDERKRKGLIRAFKQRHPADRQRRALTAAGAHVLYEIGRDGCESWRNAVASLRRGDVLYVEAIALLPDERVKGKIQPAVDLIEALDEIRDKGAVVIETSTGRRSDSKADLMAMRADAIKALGAGGRSLPSKKARENGSKGGRRAKVFSDADLRRAELVWNGLKRWPRWEDARDALPKGFTVHRAHKLWGARGSLAKR
jgi:hypothetical protein